MTNRSIARVTIVAAAAVIEAMLGPKPALRLVWNASESVPTGLYQVQPARDLIVTTLVVAYPTPLTRWLSIADSAVPVLPRLAAIAVFTRVLHAMGGQEPHLPQRGRHTKSAHVQ
jgi:type IV secretory pathway protease TraF